MFVLISFPASYRPRGYNPEPESLDQRGMSVHSCLCAFAHSDPSSAALRVSKDSVQISSEQKAIHVWDCLIDRAKGRCLGASLPERDPGLGQGPS